MKHRLVFFAFLFGICVAAQSSEKHALITDLAESTETVSSIKLLFNGIKFYRADNVTEENVIEATDGLIVLFSDTSKVELVENLIHEYTHRGGTVFMDIRAFAALNNMSLASFLASNIRVEQESVVTSGYKRSESIVYGAMRGLNKQDVLDKSMVILGYSGANEVTLVEQADNNGKIIAQDIISMQAPAYPNGTENKYLFLVNTMGNAVEYGSFYTRHSYNSLVNFIRGIADAYPTKLEVIDEGPASGGFNIYSINTGNSSGQGILIYAVSHGNEWENAYGVINFIKYIAEHPEKNIIDLDKYYLKVIPVLNPSGFESETRQNINLVDLNRNGDYYWNSYPTGAPGNYDYKGTAPFSEPETQILKNILENGNYNAFLDIHGNPSGTGYNKCMEVGSSPRVDAIQKGKQFRDFFNESINGRYVIKLSKESVVKPFVIENIYNPDTRPTLINSLSNSCSNYGYLVELICGYGSNSFSVMLTDIATELCVAFCKTFTESIDNEPPTIPTGLALTNAGFRDFNLSWTASTDNVETTEYEVFKDAVSIGKTNKTTMFVSGLTANTSYNMTVRAGDDAGNWSEQSAVFVAKTQASNDTEVPSVPTGLAYSNVEYKKFTLTWIASTDNVAVTEYEVFRNGVSIGTTGGTIFEVTGLSPETTYNMTVRASDGAGNWSVQSEGLSVQTAAFVGAISNTTAWQSFDLPEGPQTSTFTVEYDATPLVEGTWGCTTFQNAEITNFDDMACGILFYDSGIFYAAYNGGSKWSASSPNVSWTVGKTYHFIVEINIPTRKYNVYVIPEGSTERQTIAYNYTFRTSQQITQITSYGIFALTGSHSVSNVTITTTSANHNPHEDSISVYQSQSNTLSVNGASEGDRIQIYSIDGRMMLQGNICNENIIVNIDKGLYLVKIFDRTESQLKMVNKMILE